MSDVPLSYESTDYVDNFHPRRYLQEFYSMELLGNADTAIASRATVWLQSQREFHRAIDFGCGPVLEYPFLFAPCIQSMDYADYLPANLEEITKWTTDQENAFDWDPLFRGILKCIAGDASSLELRKQQLRMVSRDRLHCDLCRPQLLDVPRTYDLVTSFHCVECVAKDNSEWQTMMTRLFSLLESGGGFFISTMRYCSTYQVLGKVFPAVSLDVDDCQRMFEINGLDGQITVHDCPEFTEAGFSQIMLLSGTKTGVTKLA